MKKAAYITRLSIAGIVLLLSILASVGLFYKFHFFNIEIVSLLQRVIFDYSIAAVILFVCILAVTLIFGRIYCSTLCPLGLLQELVSLILRKDSEPAPNYGIKYLIAAVVFGTLISGSALFVRYIDPYTIFTSAFSISVFGIIALILILTLVLFKNRFFCTNICPVGTVLGLISKISLLKMYMSDECFNCGMCERNCPAGCIDSAENKIDNEMCVKCLKCMTVCPKDAMNYGIKPKEYEPFSLNRRKLIYGISAAALIGAAYASGLHFFKESVIKIKMAILPPGGENSARMENKCLNCNLCVNNCPNKILEKANGYVSSVHINFEKGKKYCKYDCNKCSEVCPSGAIKKIKLSEKQNTRIAMAMVKDECLGCQHCVDICPKNAISIDGGKAKVDGSLCIGCGKCSAFCPHNAIDIVGIKKQGII